MQRPFRLRKAYGATCRLYAATTLGKPFTSHLSPFTAPPHNPRYSSQGLWWMSEGPDESASHTLWIDEPNRLRDPLDRFIALLDPRFCGFSSQSFNRFSRGLSGLS
jgi:hypothetical protein